MTRSMLVMLTVALSACSSQIQHGLDEREANELVSVLTTRGFAARKVVEKGKKPSWAIEVDDDRATDALRLLAQLKLPRSPKLTTAKIASETALIETPATERLRQLEGQEGDLEQALETIDGVTSAAVELVVPLPPRPGAVASVSKASALLRVSTEAVERLEHQRAELRALVAASVDGLTAEQVILVIDEVQGHAAAVEPPVQSALRWVVAFLGVLLSLLALGLVAMALRLRALARAPQLPVSQSERPAPQPVVATKVQRKIA